MSELDPSLTAPDVSNRLMADLIGHLDEQMGEEAVSAALESCGLTRDYLRQEEAWVSYMATERFTDALARSAYGLDERPGPEHEMWAAWLKQGRTSADGSGLGALADVARTLGSPRGAYRAFPTLAKAANRRFDFEVKFPGPGQARVSLFARNKTMPVVTSGRWTIQGILEMIPTLWGGPRAEVVQDWSEQDPVHFDVRFVERRSRLIGLVAYALVGTVVATAIAVAAGIPPVGWGVAGGLMGLLFESARHGMREQGLNRANAQRFQDALVEADARYERLWNEEKALRHSLLASRKLAGYLSRDLVSDILEDPELEPKLGGQRTVAAVLFADIVGYTPRCEELTPEEVVEELNLYFSHVDPVFLAHDGVIDKRIGDGVMVVFVKREDQPPPDQRAVSCGVDMLRALRRANTALFRSGRQPMQIRVGVAAGPLIQGNMGSPARLEYTVIGDTVNLAARLESSATPNHVLIDASIAVPEGEHEVRDRRTITVKGKREPIDVVELAPR